MIPVQSFGFNPFKVLSPVTSVIETSSVDEALDFSDAVVDLMDESGVSESTVQELESHVKRLEAVKSQINEINYIGSEFRSFTDFDLNRSKSLAQKLRTISRKIKQGKRITQFFSKKTGKTSSASLQIEQIRVNYQILDEMRNLRISQFNQYLEEKERKIKLQAALEEALKTEHKEIKTQLSKFKRSRKTL
jgi:hypothetical protein